MAGNKNSGRTITFSISDNELDRLIQEYKNQVADGTICRASWPHFCSFLGYTEPEIAEVIGCAGNAASGYCNRGKALKRAATWMRGQLMSSPGWSGQNAAKAIFGLKQDIGDGVRWQDKDTGPSGPAEIKVIFGGDDPRAKKAAK